MSAADFCSCEAPVFDAEHDAGCRRCGLPVDFTPRRGDVRSEWRPGVDFAEFAEAVGVPTSQVMLAHSSTDGRVVVVVFTPDALPDDDPDGVDTTAWAAKLCRDHDRILRLLEPAAATPFSVHELCESLMRVAS
jgi:hypothetical protein